MRINAPELGWMIAAVLAALIFWSGVLIGYSLRDADAVSITVERLIAEAAQLRRKESIAIATLDTLCTQGYETACRMVR